jgi:hypothetical protein
MVKDQNDPSDKNARLTLRHTYMPKVPVDFAGPSYFGGKDDQLVLCAAKSKSFGDILLSSFLKIANQAVTYTSGIVSLVQYYIIFGLRW